MQPKASFFFFSFLFYFQLLYFFFKLKLSEYTMKEEEKKILIKFLFYATLLYGCRVVLFER